MVRRHTELRLATPPPGAAASAARPPFDAAAGERVLVEHRVPGLRECVALSGDAPPGGWVSFWRGYVAQFDDLERARRHWLEAEERFASEQDGEGLELAACGLVQCTLLDSQSFDGYATREARVAASDPDARGATPLAVFRAAARLLVAGEYLDTLDRHAGDVERVFAALGSDLDAEVRLRCATSALHAIGRSIDRVRAADFHDAGAAVAMLPEVGAYSRALWQVLLSVARWADPQAVPRLLSELEVVDRLDSSGPTRRLKARARLLRAVHALTANDLITAREQLALAHPLLDPSNARDYYAFHFIASRHALASGDVDTAAAHSAMALRKGDESQARATDVTPLMMQDGMVNAALGHFGAATARFARAADLSSGQQVAPCLSHLHLARALELLQQAAFDEARAEIVAGFAQARSVGLVQFFRVTSRLAAEVCGAALDLHADADFARQVIATRALASPDPGVAGWPWPLRIRALGGFALEQGGQPFRFGRKAPKRLLDLLRLLVALGGRQVDMSRIATTLWPEAEGDEARDSLKAMLHRARALLGGAVLMVRDGQIAFDESSVWLDTWAFDHVSGRIETLLLAGGGALALDDGELERRRLQLFALYRGNFLGEGDVPAWAVAVRERWRARFVRSALLLGQHNERVGRVDAAIALYRSAIEQDNLAEELYQRLIECHVARGEHAQALGAYRRCRELLSIVLGIKPSARTQALVAHLTGG
jgi:DNA-binding SARP family transcriptional activator